MKEGVNRQILLVEKRRASSGPSISASSKALCRSRATARSFCAWATYRWTPPTALGCMERPLDRRWRPTPSWPGERAEVIELKAPGFAPGDLVFSDTGWQDYAVLPADRSPRFGPERHLSQCSDSEAIGGGADMAGARSK